MYKFSLLLILLAAVSIKAQEKTLPNQNQDIVISKTFTAQYGACYLDSIKIDLSKTYLDWDNIKDIRSYQGALAKTYSHTPSAILITQKKHAKLILLKDMAALKTDELEPDEETPVIVIDGKLIADLEGYQIEESCITGISVLRNSKNTDPSLRRPTTILFSTKNKTLNAP